MQVLGVPNFPKYSYDAPLLRVIGHFLHPIFSPFLRPPPPPGVSNVILLLIFAVKILEINSLVGISFNVCLQIHRKAFNLFYRFFMSSLLFHRIHSAIFKLFETSLHSSRTHSPVARKRPDAEVAPFLPRKGKTPYEP